MGENEVELAGMDLVRTEKAQPFLRAADAYSVALEAGGSLFKEWDDDLGLYEEGGAMLGMALFEAVDTAVMDIRSEGENLSDLEDALGISDQSPVSLEELDDPYGVESRTLDPTDEEIPRLVHNWDSDDLYQLLRFATDPEMEKWTDMRPADRFDESSKVEDPVNDDRFPDLINCSGQIVDNIRDMPPEYWCDYLTFGFHKEFYDRWLANMTDRYFSDFSEDLAEDLYNGEQNWEDAFWEVVDDYDNSLAQLEFIEYITRDLAETKTGREKFMKLLDPGTVDNRKRNLLELFTTDGTLTPDDSVVRIDISSAFDENIGYALGAIGHRILITLRKELSTSPLDFDNGGEEVLKIAGKVTGTMLEAIEELAGVAGTPIDVKDDLQIESNDISELKKYGGPSAGIGPAQFPNQHLDPGLTDTLGAASSSQHKLFFQLGLFDWGVFTGDKHHIDNISEKSSVIMLNVGMKLMGGAYVNRAVASDPEIEVNQSYVAHEASVAMEEEFLDELEDGAIDKLTDITGNYGDLASDIKTRAGVVMDIHSALDDFQTASKREALGQGDEALVHATTGATTLGLTIGSVAKGKMAAGIVAATLKSAGLALIVTVLFAGFMAAWLAWVKTPEIIVWIENTKLGTNDPGLETKDTGEVAFDAAVSIVSASSPAAALLGHAARTGDALTDEDYIDDAFPEFNVIAGSFFGLGEDKSGGSEEDSFIDFESSNAFDVGDEYWMFDHPNPAVAVTRQISMFQYLTDEFTVEVQYEYIPDITEIDISELGATPDGQILICPVYTNGGRVGFGIPLRIKLQDAMDAPTGTQVGPEDTIVDHKDVASFAIEEKSSGQIDKILIELEGRPTEHPFFKPDGTEELDSSPTAYEIIHVPGDAMGGPLGEIDGSIAANDTETLKEALHLLNTTPLTRTVVEVDDV